MYNERNQIQKEVQNIDNELFKWEEDSKNLDNYQQEKVSLETSIQHLNNTLDDYEKQIIDINSKINSFELEKQNFSNQNLDQQQDLIKQCFQYVLQLEQLIEDNVNNLNLSKKLQEDEKKLSRLYSILSKEIVLFALDDYLPILSDIINDYLSQCVDYSIRMQIVEN